MTDFTGEQGEHEHPNDKGDPGPPGKPGKPGLPGAPGASPGNELLQAVHDLSAQVSRLSATLSREYPKRSEVRREGRKRAYQFFATAMIAVIIAQIFTISTISYCFLGPTGTKHSACSIIPGYDTALSVGAERLKRFELLITQIEKNRQEIKILKMEVAELQERRQKTPGG